MCAWLLATMPRLGWSGDPDQADSRLRGADCDGVIIIHGSLVHHRRCRVTGLPADVPTVAFVVTLGAVPRLVLNVGNPAFQLMAG